MLWKLQPEMKLEVNDAAQQIQTKALSVDVYLIENAVSRLQLTANNRDGRTYLRSLRALDTINCYFRYSDEEWTQVFGGVTEKLAPTMSPSRGHTLQATAYGYGRALRNTHCAVDYGSESENSGFDTPSEIIDDLKTNRINKNFDAGNTGYNILGGNILTMNNPSIQYIMGGYRKNIEILNDVLLMYQAYRDGSAGCHWMVTPSRYLHVDQIGNHTKNPTVWPTYWRHNSTDSLLQQKRDIKLANFFEDATNYANKIILFTDFRKPAYDYLTENQHALWGNSNLVSISSDAVTYIVGSYSLKLLTDSGAGLPGGYAYFPSTEDAGWDLSTWGSIKSIPRLNFYMYKDGEIAEALTSVRLFTTGYNTDYFEALFSTWTEPDDEWVHKSIPIGPYWSSAEESQQYRWVKGTGGAPGGNADWTDINGIAFMTFRSGANAATLRIDDLHVTGKLIREAYNSDAITAYNEVQRIIKMETSVNDSLKASDDSGTAARLAYAELLKAQTIPVRGEVTLPLAPTIKQGQLAPIKFGHTSGTSYHIDDTFRIQQAHHHFGEKPATILTVTDDLVNTFAVGPNEALSVLKKALFYDPEAKSLKTTGVDTFVERLSKDYA